MNEKNAIKCIPHQNFTEIPTLYMSLTQLYTILMKLIITLLGKWRSSFFLENNKTNLFYKVIIRTDDIMFIIGSAQPLIH